MAPSLPPEVALDLSIQPAPALNRPALNPPIDVTGRFTSLVAGGQPWIPIHQEILTRGCGTHLSGATVDTGSEALRYPRALRNQWRNRVKRNGASGSDHERRRSQGGRGPCGSK